MSTIIADYWQKIKCDTNKHTKPFKCAVISCKITFDPANKSQTYKFHRFPINSHQQKQWIKQCRIEKCESTYNLMVCSKHFNLEDYDRNYKLEFTNPKYRRCLKDDAIPTLYLDGNPVIENVDELKLPPIPHPSTIPYNKYAAPIRHSSKTLNTTATTQKSRNVVLVIEPDLPDLESSEAELEMLQKEYEAMQTEDELLTQTCVDIKNEIQDKRVILAKQIRQNKTAMAKNGYGQCIHIINRIFTTAQINILKGHKKVVWSDDDLAQAFTIRHMGNKDCYLFLKYTLNYPLPALSAVQRWAAKRSLTSS